MDLVNLDFVKLSPNIKTPTKVFSKSIDNTYWIKNQIPDGHYGHLCSKSGLAMRYNIHVGAGIVDPDYTREIKVLLLNFGW